MSTSLELEEHKITGFLRCCTNIENLITNKRIALAFVLIPARKKKCSDKT